MCLILLAYESHPACRLVLAANRDEFYARPTRRASFWEDAPGVLGGRDLTHGGTWIGVTLGGRVAAVTNFRDPARQRADAPSRGRLVSDFLLCTEAPRQYLERLADGADSYNGFNLFVGDARGLYYFSNRDDAGPRELTPGVYGLSNHLLDTPWPKVERGKQALSEVLKGDEHAPDAEPLFMVLAESERAPDEKLPDTGVGLELERMLSPLFIRSAEYGTRSSAVVLFEREGRVTFVERSFDTGAGGWEDARFQFDVRDNHRGRRSEKQMLDVGC